MSCVAYNQSKIVLSEAKRVLKSMEKLISVTFTSQKSMFKTELSNKKVSPLIGPLSNNGTVRLIDELDINNLCRLF